MMLFLSCIHIAIPSIKLGDISRAYEVINLGDSVIREFYSRSSRISRYSEKIRKSMAIKILPEISKVNEFYRIAFEMFDPGMDFYEAKREGLSIKPYNPIPTKLLMNEIRKEYSHMGIMKNKLKIKKEIDRKEAAELFLGALSPRVLRKRLKTPMHKLTSFSKLKSGSPLREEISRKSSASKIKLSRAPAGKGSFTMHFLEATGNIEPHAPSVAVNLPGVANLDNDRKISAFQNFTEKPSSFIESGKGMGIDFTQTKASSFRATFIDNSTSNTNLDSFSARMQMLSQRDPLPSTFRKKRIGSANPQIFNYIGNPKILIENMEKLTKETQEIINQKHEQMKRATKLVSNTYFRNYKQEEVFAVKKRAGLNKSHGPGFMKMKFTHKQLKKAESHKNVIFIGDDIPKPEKKSKEIASHRSSQLGNAVETQSNNIGVEEQENTLINKKVFKIKRSSGLSKPLIFFDTNKYSDSITNVDDYFKGCIDDLLEVDKRNEEFEEKKIEFLYNQYKDEYDYKEFNFCKTMIKTKEIENINNINHKEEVILSDLDLQHRVATAVASHQANEEIAAHQGIEILARFIYRFGKALYKKHTKIRLADILLRHPEVFKLANVYDHRKRLEKDPKYAAFETQIQEYFIRRAKNISQDTLKKRSQQVLFNLLRLDYS